MPDGYSLVKTHRGWLGEITVAPEQSPQQAVQDLGVTGYAFHSSDNKDIVQFRRDGFSFSRLAPYTAWEDVSEKTVGFWRLYLETAEPIEVTRLAIRTINRIALLEWGSRAWQLLDGPACDPARSSESSAVVSEPEHDPG